LSTNERLWVLLCSQKDIEKLSALNNLTTTKRYRRAKGDAKAELERRLSPQSPA
jgi:hypothetical protein